MQPQPLFGFAPLYIPVKNTGNKIMSRTSAQLNVSLHCLWIKTNSNYLSPDEPFCTFQHNFLSMFDSKAEIYFQGIHVCAYT